MSEQPTETGMVHYECYTCHMTATCVATPAAVLAWLDHMATHLLQDNYGAWTWAVVPLPLD